MVADRDGQNLRTQPRAATDLAWLACHERSNPVAGKLAFGLRIEPLHLRHDSLKWFRQFFLPAIRTEIYLNRTFAGPEIESVLEGVRQIGERRVFVDPKMFYERALEFSVIGLHPLRAASPGSDGAGRDRFFRLRDDQLGVDDKLGAKAMACRTGPEMAIKGKMFG